MARNQIGRPLPLQPLQYSKRLPDKAVEQIKALIDNGVLRPGDRLPGERELSAQLSVGRTSVREALRVLEALELIEIKPGAGAVVRSPSLATARSSRWNALIVRRQGEITDWAEIREGLESYAASLAAIRASSEDIRRMRAATEKMERGVEQGDVVAILEGDMQFHDSLNDATGNQSLIRLSGTINRALFDTRYAFFDIPGFAEESCRNHREVLRAIESRDSEAAFKAMVNHIRRVKARIAELGEAPDKRPPTVLDDESLITALMSDVSREEDGSSPLPSSDRLSE